MARQTFVLVVLALFGLVSSRVPNVKADCPSGHKEFQPKQWSYGADATRWGEICGAYKTCDVGQQQSPINIPSNSPTTSNLEIRYGMTDVSMVRVDQTVSMPVKPPAPVDAKRAVSGQSTIQWNNREYTLEFVEFHHPSEHTINGKHSPLEVQFYHSATVRGVKHYTAVAVLFEGTHDDNKVLKTLDPLFPRVTTCKCGNGRTENWANTVFGEQCDCGARNNNTVDGMCREDCKLARCGDTNVDTSLGEECDDGEAGNSDVSGRVGVRCRANCTLPKCGDNIHDPDNGEECDIGHVISQPQNGPYYSCDSFCKDSCGNGIIDPYMNTTWQEECDLGKALNSNQPNQACRTNCMRRRCGDGVTDTAFNETCDLGTFTDDNGIVYYGGVGPQNITINGTSIVTPNCRPNCSAPLCGDGVLDNLYPPGNGEQCDTGILFPQNSTGDLTSPCNMVTGPLQCKFKCGDGFVVIRDNNTNNYFEECDNGVLNSDTLPNQCRRNCRAPSCGDGVVDTGEQCDDGHNLPGRPANGTDRCTSVCTFRCGNSFVDGATTNGVLGFTIEECDNGPEFFIGINPPRVRDNGNSDTRPNACRNNCKLPRCGDGVTDNLLGEQCDKAGLNSDVTKDACRLNCQRACCGDGVTDTGEDCDHGMGSAKIALALNLSSSKTNPLGNAPVTNWGCSSDCKKLCGDGVRGDWNPLLGLGEQCDDGQLNSDSTPDKCRSSCVINYCGDGIVDHDEECDDGADLSVCDANCKRKYCGDGVVDTVLGEECDNGAANSYNAASHLGCSPLCTLNRCGLTENFNNRITNFKLEDLLWSSPVDKSFKPTPCRPGDFYYYKGSWTRPPCTENVDWLVLKQKQTVSFVQLENWQSAVGRNARPVQHLMPSRVSSPFNDHPVGTPADTVSTCGNGIKEKGEECDNGSWNNDRIPNRCRENCKLPRCGDNVRDQGEECDGEPWCNLCRQNSMFNGHSTNYNNSMSCEYWNYDFSHLWNTMGKGCESCFGMKQSPIDIPTNCEGKSKRALSLNHPSNIQYVHTPVVLFNTGNQILFPVLNGGTFSFNGATYVLEHMSFHSPSEHTIGGKRFDFEVQLHHKIQNPGREQNAALSVLFEKGEKANEFFDKFWNVLPPTHECMCGNGIKEDQYYWPDGRITKEECDAGKENSDILPNHCRTNCRLPYCGDGVIDTNEACDWGKANSMVAGHCRPDCSLPTCGDGIVDMGEECDDANGNNIDMCDNNCKKTCGNGVKEGDEQCDDGPFNSDSKANACRMDCNVSKCGDGIIDNGEECDNGPLNGVGPDKCSLNCTLPFCGDGKTDPMNGEECDGTPDCTTNPATAGQDLGRLKCQKLCGNGVVEGTEECDDGPGNSDVIPNACRTNCKKPICGDPVRDEGEQCDSALPFPAAQTHCFQCKVVCGNGFLEQNVGPTGYDEECDHGIMNGLRPNSCRPNCKLPSCGDGIVDTAGPCFEECDDGAANGNVPGAKCRTNCRLPFCGDGIRDANEECDDGKETSICTVNCQLKCGNGRVEEGEQCDDGEQNSNKGGCCRSNCKLPFCGDAITDPGEECDDGAANQDGPNACRTNCKLPKCGDGIVDFMFGEKCDNAHLNGNLVVDGCSPKCTPNVCGQSINPDVSVTPHDLIPTAPGAYCYDGSINQPPCTENTQWFVFAAPQSISECQLNQFKRIKHMNIRETQPLNGRQVSFLSEDAVCGDGLVEGNEECDAGPKNSDFEANACRRNCRKAHCGDGIQDAGEQCDGTPNCGPNCLLSCPAGSSCPNCNATNVAMGGSGGGDSNYINVNFGSSP